MIVSSRPGGDDLTVIEVATTAVCQSRPPWINAQGSDRVWPPADCCFSVVSKGDPGTQDSGSQIRSVPCYIHTAPVKDVHHSRVIKLQCWLGPTFSLPSATNTTTTPPEFVDLRFKLRPSCQEIPAPSTCICSQKMSWSKAAVTQTRYYSKKRKIDWSLSTRLRKSVTQKSTRSALICSPN